MVTRTAVYRAQVKTATVGLSVVPRQWHLLRLLRPYRNPESHAARSQLAQKVWAMRRAGLPFPPAPSLGVCTAYPTGVYAH